MQRIIKITDLAGRIREIDVSRFISEVGELELVHDKEDNSKPDDKKEDQKQELEDNQPK